MTFDSSNYSPESVEDTPAQAVRPDAGKTSGEMVDYLYQELRKRNLIEYGSVIPVELIREIVDLPEPNIHGLAPKEIRKAFQDDSLALLTLRDRIFEKFLLDRGMAIKQHGDTWAIPKAEEMHAIWKGYASKATRAIRRAKHLMRNAPSSTASDSVFAQQQAARISRQVVSLQETAVKLF